jgi:cytochrome c oxidase subunit 1
MSKNKQILESKNNHTQSTQNQDSICFGWLALSIVSVAISGFFAIFLVFLRTPGLANIFSKDIFQTSLIIHVDLSITVWMLTIFCFINATLFSGMRKALSVWILILAFIGTTLMSIAPLAGGEPILNNYVPILNNFPFILGLSLFFTAVLISAIFSLIEFIYSSTSYSISYTNITSIAGSIIYIVALVCFYLSHTQLAKLGMHYDIHHYYETLFWGFGHIIQFLYVQLMIFAWVIVMNQYKQNQIITPSNFAKISLVNILACAICPLFYLFATVESGIYIEYFTMHMKYFGGIASSIMAIILLWHYFNNSQCKTDYKFYSFICSVFVFGIGGAIGYMIHETNVTVPAHYHGSIVGITIALMGLVYYIISDFGYAFKSTKLLNIQLLIYAIGQTLHITGLSLSGGYGALRKTAGVELSNLAKFYMGLMGTGGLIAVISGVLFVINCYIALKNGKAPNE